jgi:hypothetical protein
MTVQYCTDQTLWLFHCESQAQEKACQSEDQSRSLCFIAPMNFSSSSALSSCPKLRRLGPCEAKNRVPWRCTMPNKTITLVATAFLLSGSPAAFSQPDSKNRSTGSDAAESVTQPQGQTGPLNTESTGAAPASSPEGETPPGMQATPKGSDQPARSEPPEKSKETPKN